MTSGLDWPRLLLRLLGRRLPPTRGRLRVGGLDGPLTIRRDRWGIPHIDAATDADAWFGLGFCQAQDRGFQLEILLRVGSGTLSELIGPDGLPIDTLSRRLGFRRIAEAQAGIIGADVNATLEAYASGINAGFARGISAAPHELRLLRRRPTPWTVQDVLAFVGLQSFSLSSNWDNELARLKVLTDDGADALRALEPVYADWLPVTSPPGTAAGLAIDRLGEDLAAFQAAVPVGGASNNWAIAGSRTASGKPILANDPHLAPRLPAPWYLAHVRTPDWEVAGASFVGGPAFPIGTNGFAAWGITAGLTDNTDLFLEELGPDGASVREGGTFVRCEVVTERIAVKGGEAVEERVLLSPRGPVITALLDPGSSQALSMSAVWLRPLPLRGFLDVVRAHSFDEFRRGFAEWPGPALNIAYADTDGHIGWQLVGQLPRRRRGNGTIPLAGWDPGNGWDDEPVPFDEMPFELDPATGWVASANNLPTPDGSGPFLGVDYADGYRIARIGEVLGGRTGWDVAASQSLQMDTTSLPWRELREFVLALSVDAAADPWAARGLEILHGWDGEVTADSKGATVYQAFLTGLTQRLARVKAPNAWRWAIGEGFGQIVPRTMLWTRAASRAVRLLREQPADWFPDSSWEAEAIAALGDEMRALAQSHGEDPEHWAWGHLRQLTLEHPLGARRPLDRIFNLGPIPMGGDSNTPMQASSGPIRPFANPGFLANTRCVFDLDDPAASRFSLAGGQSGNPFSPHYADLFELWRRGEGVPIAWGEGDVAAATRDTLVLEPASRDVDGKAHD
jgi:penicillin G amidase